MRGYHNDPEATATAFAGGWFHSGDAAVVHPNGYIEIRDQMKDVIISGGENISSIEVEAMLLRHEAVLEAAVVGMPQRSGARHRMPSSCCDRGARPRRISPSSHGPTWRIQGAHRLSPGERAAEDRHGQEEVRPARTQQCDRAPGGCGGGLKPRRNSIRGHGDLRAQGIRDVALLMRFVVHPLDAGRVGRAWAQKRTLGCSTMRVMDFLPRSSAFMVPSAWSA